MIRKKKKEYINIIQSNNELLLRLINDILDLSKIESGIIERRKENFNLAKVCNELFVTIQAKMTNPNVELRLDGPNSECWVLLDRNRLKQVWMNFLTNAVKCTNPDILKWDMALKGKVFVSMLRIRESVYRMICMTKYLPVLRN